jgi:hypothetical protein
MCFSNGDINRLLMMMMMINDNALVGLMLFRQKREVSYTIYIKIHTYNSRFIPGGVAEG